MNIIVGIRAISRVLGVSYETVRQWRKAGRLRYARETADGLLWAYEIDLIDHKMAIKNRKDEGKWRCQY